MCPTPLSTPHYNHTALSHVCRGMSLRPLSSISSLLSALYPAAWTERYKSGSLVEDVQELRKSGRGHPGWGSAGEGVRCRLLRLRSTAPHLPMLPPSTGVEPNISRWVILCGKTVCVKLWCNVWDYWGVAHFCLQLYFIVLLLFTSFFLPPYHVVFFFAFWPASTTRWNGCLGSGWKGGLFIFFLFWGVSSYLFICPFCLFFSC